MPPAAETHQSGLETAQCHTPSTAEIPGLQAGEDINESHGTIEFTDLYLPSREPMAGYLFPGPRPISKELHRLVDDIMEKIREAQGDPEGSSNDFSIRVGSTPFRVCRLPSFAGEFYILRRMPERLWTLKDCGFSKPVQDHMLHPRLCHGGLVIICGMPGAGKSTTAAALIVSRLETFGGVCLTVEDPIEMPLEGLHGDGLCLQRTVSSDEEFYIAVKETLRGYPAHTKSILMIGEIRDSNTAALSLQAAIDGRLVILTMHGQDIVPAVQRHLSLAAKLLGPNEARSIMADSLRMVLHQRIEPATNPNLRPYLKYRILLDTERAAAIIRTPKTPLSILADEITLQQNSLRMKRPIDVRFDNRK